MDLQNETIKHFMEHFNFPTLREVSKLTGINTSRIFRIFKGGEMKLGEFQIFCQRVNQRPKAKDNTKIHQLVGKLSSSALEDIEEYIEEKLKVNQLVRAGRMG